MGEPIVEISDGKLRGTTAKHYKGEEYYQFLGIPYAKPPLGALRFKAPQPIEPWSGIKDATQNGSQCYQRDIFTQKYEGTEDCLFINVFTKNIADKQSLKPVLVFIHGGAFIMGSNKTTIYSPIYLMMNDIVFVSINYRIGVLGFLKLEDTSLGVPGNAALKDQLLALKWIQKNIKHFGGDPNNVTIYGESAGSASVNYHILSPCSKGLFHKAIMQSGTVLNPWPYLGPYAIEMVKYLKDGCKTEKEILDTLMEAPVDLLVQAQDKLMLEEAPADKHRLFGPCIEKPNETAFITKHPIDIITSGDYNKVPLMIGFNSNEGLLALMDFTKSSSSSKIIYDFFIPREMELPSKSEQAKEICRILKNVYSDDRPSDRFFIFGDSMFVAGTVAFIENLLKTSNEPIYYHRLSLCSSRNVFKNLLRCEIPGVCHGDDLGYFFDSQIFPAPPIQPGSIEETAILRYMKLTENFVKYGNPTVDEQEFGLIWKPVTKDAMYCLDFDKELTLTVNPEEERMKVWRDIYGMHSKTKNYMLPNK